MKKLFPYQQLFERQLWVDILSKHITPNNPTTKILPSRKIQIDSAIIITDHVLEIASWIDKKDSSYVNERPYEFQINSLW